MIRHGTERISSNRSSKGSRTSWITLTGTGGEDGSHVISPRFHLLTKGYPRVCPVSRIRMEADWGNTRTGWSRSVKIQLLPFDGLRKDFFCGRGTGKRRRGEICCIPSAPSPTNTLSSSRVAVAWMILGKYITFYGWLDAIALQFFIIKQTQLKFTNTYSGPRRKARMASQTDSKSHNESV